MSGFSQLSAIVVSLVSAMMVTGCFFNHYQAEEIGLQGSSFVNVYEILTANCLSCHSEEGAARQAWSLNIAPTKDRYPQCIEAANQLLCTTYEELTGTEWPWIVAYDPQASQPFVNACDTAQSYHIGASIPKRLGDKDCALFEQWIHQGAKFN